MATETVELPSDISEIAHKISSRIIEVCEQEAGHLGNREKEHLAMYAGLTEALGSFVGAFGMTTQSVKESLDLYLADHPARDKIDAQLETSSKTKH